MISSNAGIISSFIVPEISTLSLSFVLFSPFAYTMISPMAGLLKPCFPLVSSDSLLDGRGLIRDSHASPNVYLLRGAILADKASALINRDFAATWVSGGIEIVLNRLYVDTI